MKSIVHDKHARDKLLHIEAEGCIVNIRVGLSDAKGTPTTSIEVLPNYYADDKWHFPDAKEAKAMNIRVQPFEGWQ